MVLKAVEKSIKKNSHSATFPVEGCEGTVQHSTTQHPLLPRSSDSRTEGGPGPAAPEVL